MRHVTWMIALVVAACAPNISAQTPDGEDGKARGVARSADRVVVAPEVLDGWSFLYRHITDVEFVLCLEGRKENGVVYIDGFRLARMEEATLSSVRYQPCAVDNYVGTAHNHPPVPGSGSLCYRSIPDKQSFDLDRRAVVDVVLCGDETYYWVLRDGTEGGPGARGSP